MTGRPSTFDETLAKGILDRLATGEPMARICRDDGMPHPSTFSRWCEAEHTLTLSEDEGPVPLAIAYARARDDGFDAIAAECFGISDDGSQDWEERERSDGSKYVALNGEAVARSKLRVWTRLELLKRWDPKRYGELLKLSGADGKSPVPVQNFNAEMTPQQATEAYSKMLGND